MIYLVSNEIDCSSMDGIQPLSVEDACKMIESWSVVQFDTETTGLDPHISILQSMQFGHRDLESGLHDEIVVDCKSISPELFKAVIEKSYLIGHNLKFDLEFLYNYSIVPLNVYDTMICEQVLYLGYPPKSVSFNLHDVLLRNTGIDLNKSFQKSIATKGLTEEGIRYSAGDVVYLQDIRKAQMTVADSRKCIKAFEIENRCVPAIAYLEWCGILLDKDKWTSKMSVDEAQLQQYKQQLDDYVRSDAKLNQQFVSTSTQLSLFEDSSSTQPEVLINWDSPKQVVPVFQSLGFNTKTKDKKTKKERDSALEKVLTTQKGIADAFLDIYFKYKEADKRVTSFGQGHLNQINPNTGRLHTSFNQIGTVTGRMSSGRKSKNEELAKLKGLPKGSVGYCNMQQLPAHDGGVTRACFVPEPNNVFISCDYSAEESRVQADVWNEQTLLDSFEHGIDTHNLYAKLCFPDELANVDVHDVKKLHPELRQKAKSAEFAVGYGSDGTSIAATIGMPVDKAREMVSNLLKGMPGMAAYKKKAANFLKKHGYIVINEVTGHRVYWPEWNTWKAEEDSYTTQFWNDYNMYHKGTGDEVAMRVRRHISAGHDWFEKNVLNYPIQGGSAVVIKEAAANLFRWVVTNGYFGKILFCVFVHDELDCECPKELKDVFANKMKSIMEKAAAKYYKKLPIPAEVSVGDHWIH